MLLTAVKQQLEQLKVPVKGVISDGEKPPETVQNYAQYCRIN
jgi:hypothetical protein